MTELMGTGSKAKLTFDSSIKDAEELLAHCNSLGNPLPQKAEVFKRAGLVMALTAWETYVEDRVLEGLRQRISGDGTYSDRFMLSKLAEELRRFHNPNSEKTKRLFLDYLATDVTTEWHWNGVDGAKAREKLDALVKKRGDAVHRSKNTGGATPAPHFSVEGRSAEGYSFPQGVGCRDREISRKPTPALCVADSMKQSN